MRFLLWRARPATALLQGGRGPAVGTCLHSLRALYPTLWGEHRSRYRDAALPRGPAVSEHQWSGQLLTGNNLLKAESDTNCFPLPLVSS